MSKSEKVPYNDRSELDKIKAQWTKLSGLHSREEWSAAVVRTATAAELAANFAIRQEFKQRSTFDDDFVNGLLKWANGLTGKLDKLLLPLLKSDTDKYSTVNTIKRLVRNINEERNQIVHQGTFYNQEEATILMNNCKIFIEGVVKLYKPKFKLEELKQQSTRRK